VSARSRYRVSVADPRFLYLLAKFPQEVAGCAPWPLINTLSDEDLETHVEITRELRDTYGMDTPAGAIGGGVIGGWLAQALRMRPLLLDYPVGLV
jgi:hypothetical protein